MKRLPLIVHSRKAVTGDSESRRRFACSETSTCTGCLAVSGTLKEVPLYCIDRAQAHPSARIEIRRSFVVLPFGRARNSPESVPEASGVRRLSAEYEHRPHSMSRSLKEGASAARPFVAHTRSNRQVENVPSIVTLRGPSRPTAVPHLQNSTPALSNSCC